jgi:hypothetical protein
MQPGRRGVFVVLRRPIGNRIDAKICGTMPSRVHAKMLIQQLERAESVVKDLFMEATDDGIEALEAVLAACRDEVMLRGPQLRPAKDQSESPYLPANSGEELSDDQSESSEAVETVDAVETIDAVDVDGYGSEEAEGASGEDAEGAADE